MMQLFRGGVAVGTQAVGHVGKVGNLSKDTQVLMSKLILNQSWFTYQVYTNSPGGEMRKKLRNNRLKVNLYAILHLGNFWCKNVNYYLGSCSLWFRACCENLQN